MGDRMLLYVIGAYAIVLGAVAIRGFVLPLLGSDSALLGAKNRGKRPG